MRICDICKEEGKIVLATQYCGSCYKDLCPEHIVWYDGSPYCPNCDSEGQDDCPICELPHTMCTCKRVSGEET